MRVVSLAILALLSFGTLLRPTPLSAQDGNAAAGQVGRLAGGPPIPPQQPGFLVTGHVTCADTQHPARFAQVSLIPATGTNGGFDRGRRSSGRTDLDGSFQIGNVPVGDYFVTAALTGYVNDDATVFAALNAGTDISSIHGVPIIHVAAGGASAELSIQRGAVLSGSAQWDDGTPAAGVQIGAVPATPTDATAPGPRLLNGQGPFGLSAATTDDRGRFRLSGLPPGAYLVRATVQTPARQGSNDRGFQRLLPVVVWAPDKLRRSEAVTLTLSPGEERTDLALTLALARLHTVSGQVSSPGGSVRSGTVNLADQTDRTLNRTGFINPDGSFTATYVPPGTYTLNVNASSQASGPFGRGQTPADPAGPRFQPFQESITVADGDLTGLNITVTPATNTQ